MRVGFGACTFWIGYGDRAALFMGHSGCRSRRPFCCTLLYRRNVSAEGLEFVCAWESSVFILLFLGSMRRLFR